MISAKKGYIIHQKFLLKQFIQKFSHGDVDVVFVALKWSFRAEDNISDQYIKIKCVGFS